jgi:hypothetical protein
MAIMDNDFGYRLCEILHLDPEKTRDIIIKNMINDVVVVEVTQYLMADEAEVLLVELKKYHLESNAKDKNK